MANKIFIGVALIIKDDLTLIVETCLCREESRETAETGMRNHFLGFIAKHKIEHKDLLVFVQEKDKFELQRIVSDSISVRDSFQHIIRTEIRSAMNEKPVDCVSDKFIKVSDEIIN